MSNAGSTTVTNSSAPESSGISMMSGVGSPGGFIINPTVGVRSSFTEAKVLNKRRAGCRVKSRAAQLLSRCLTRLQALAASPAQIFNCSATQPETVICNVKRLSDDDDDGCSRRRGPGILGFRREDRAWFRWWRLDVDLWTFNRRPLILMQNADRS